MPVIGVIGGQLGDEGKGKIVDAFAEGKIKRFVRKRERGYRPSRTYSHREDPNPQDSTCLYLRSAHPQYSTFPQEGFVPLEIKYIGRFNGGANAGHTVIVNGEKIILHQIPSGILHNNITNVIGNGEAINPEKLLGEIDSLKKRGVDCKNLLISQDAIVITSYHEAFERLSESSKTIQTTGQAIGQGYGFHTLRLSPLANDFYESSEELAKKFQQMDGELSISRRLLEEGLSPLNAKEEADRYMTLFQRLAPYMENTSEVLLRALENQEGIIAEGAQGTLLDIDHGTYPNVTSSNTTAAGIASGLGIPPTSIQEVIAVMKAGYMTRVGGGPFPTELGDKVSLKHKVEMNSREWFELDKKARAGAATDAELGIWLREMGDEYGATTGRPRRTGWFDEVAAKYVVRLNGVDWIAFTKLDIPNMLPEMKVCTEYYCDHERRTGLFDSKNLENYVPVYGRTIPGSQTDISGIREYSKLPSQVKDYVESAQDSLGVPVGIVSVGPERDQTIYRV
jgi:adenylosuccinate synthase